RLVQAMLTQRAANPSPARFLCNDERRIRYVPPVAGLIRTHAVGPNNHPVLLFFSRSQVFLGNVRMRTGLKQICQRVLARDAWINWICFSGCDQLAKD